MGLSSELRPSMHCIGAAHGAGSGLHVAVLQLAGGRQHMSRTQQSSPYASLYREPKDQSMAQLFVPFDAEFATS
jgi:hypothetical protein